MMREKLLVTAMAIVFVLTSCGQPAASPTPTAEAEKLIYLVTCPRKRLDTCPMQKPTTRPMRRGVFWVYALR